MKMILCVDLTFILSIVVHMINRLLDFVSIKIFISLIIFFLIFEKIHWDPNPTHDGYIYSNALMVSKGYFPNKDFFAQYGPGAPLIQGHFLRYFGESIFVLRVFNLILLSAICILMFKLLKKYIGSNSSFLISAFWFLLHVTSWAWPSNITTFFTLCSIHLCQKRMNKTNISNAQIILASLLIGVSVFVRIHTIVQVFLVLFFLLTTRAPRRILISWLIGSFTGIVSCLLILLHLGALEGYFNQSILWASQQGVYMSGDGGTRELSLLSFVLASKWYFIVSLELIAVLYLLKSLPVTKFKYRDLFQIISVGITALIVGYIGLSSNRNFLAENASHGKYALGMFIAVFILFFPFYALVKFRYSISGKNAMDYLPFTIAIATLPQLYSSPDGAHLWWIMPVLFVGFFSLPILQKEFTKTFSNKALTYLILFSLILSLIDFTAGNRVKRVALYNSIEIEMSGTKDYLESVDSTLSLLSSIVKKDETLLNVCPSAIFSVANNRLLTYNRHVGDWDPRAAEAINNPNYVFICGSKSEFIDVSVFSKYNVIFEKATNDPVLGTLRILER